MSTEPRTLMIVALVAQVAALVCLLPGMPNVLALPLMAVVLVALVIGLATAPRPGRGH